MACRACCARPGSDDIVDDTHAPHQPQTLPSPAQQLQQPGDVEAGLGNSSVHSVPPGSSTSTAVHSAVGGGSSAAAVAAGGSGRSLVALALLALHLPASWAAPAEVVVQLLLGLAGAAILALPLAQSTANLALVRRAAHYRRPAWLHQLQAGQDDWWGGVGPTCLLHWH